MRNFIATQAKNLINDHKNIQITILLSQDWTNNAQTITSKSVAHDTDKNTSFDAANYNDAAFKNNN